MKGLPSLLYAIQMPNAHHCNHTPLQLVKAIHHHLQQRHRVKLASDTGTGEILPLFAVQQQESTGILAQGQSRAARILPHLAHQSRQQRLLGRLFACVRSLHGQSPYPSEPQPAICKKKLCVYFAVHEDCRQKSRITVIHSVN